MDYIKLVQWLWESKAIMIAPGWVAIVASGYIWTQVGDVSAEVTGVKDAVTALQQTQLEERLDKAYGSLCMIPGDPALLERIRDLQQEYARVTGARYHSPSCDLLMKLLR